VTHPARSATLKAKLQNASTSPIARSYVAAEVTRRIDFRIPPPNVGGYENGQ